MMTPALWLISALVAVFVVGTIAYAICTAPRNDHKR